MAHTEIQTYSVRLGDRGRLVLPAELRRRAGLREGQELVLIYANGVVHLATRQELTRAARGMFSGVGRGRDLVAELIAERREEARREASARPPSTRKRAP
jgi:AbrB family looped-hinge helix DNA binding protein